jgi:uncharacterized protein
MPTPLQEELKTLLALQQIDSHIQRLKKTLTSMDDGAKLKAAAVSAEQAHAEGVKTLHTAQGNLKDSELKLTALEAKLKSYKDKFYQGTVTNARELTNIEKEIDALGRQRSDLDGKILVMMETVENQEQVVKSLSETAVKDRAAYDAHYAAYLDRKSSLSKELAATSAKRPEAVAAVTNAALLKRYEELRPRSAGMAIAPIVEGACGGCHMKLPSFQVTKVKQGEELQNCENCGRMLAV